MKFFKLIFFTIFSLLIVVVVGGYLVIRLYGQRIVEEELSQALHRKVSVEDVRLIFPFGLHIKNIEAEQTFKARSVRAHLVMPFFAGRRLVFSKLVLIQPVFYVYRDRDGIMVWRHPDEGPGTEKGPAARKPEPAKAAKHSFLAEHDWAIFVSYLEMDDGKVEYWDYSHDKLFSLLAKDITLKAHGIYYPVYDENIKFDFTGNVSGSNFLFAEGAVKARGWVNFASKSMDAKVDLDDEKAGLQLSESAVAEHDKMKVEGKAFLRRPDNVDLSIVPEDSLQAFLLKNVRTTGLTVTVNHSFETTMSRFDIGKMKVWGDFGYQAEDKKTAAAALKEELKDLGKQVGQIGKKIYDPSSGEKKQGEEVPSAGSNRTPPPVPAASAPQ